MPGPVLGAGTAEESETRSVTSSCSRTPGRSPPGLTGSDIRVFSIILRGAAWRWAAEEGGTNYSGTLSLSPSLPWQCPQSGQSCLRRGNQWIIVWLRMASNNGHPYINNCARRRSLGLCKRVTAILHWDFSFIWFTVLSINFQPIFDSRLSKLIYPLSKLKASYFYKYGF